MDIEDTSRDLNCIKSEIAGLPKFFVIHEGSGYVMEVGPETYSGLQKIKEGEWDKLTSEERAKLMELQNYLNQLPPLGLEYNEDYGFLLGGASTFPRPVISPAFTATQIKEPISSKSQNLWIKRQSERP